MTMRELMMLATAAFLMSMAGGAYAAEIEVKMLNKGAQGAMVFEPAGAMVGDRARLFQNRIGRDHLPRHQIVADAEIRDRALGLRAP